MSAIPNLPDGWVQASGTSYAKVPLSFMEGAAVYVDPGDEDWPIEVTPSAAESMQPQDAEELIRRLSEAVAICKAGRS